MVVRLGEETIGNGLVNFGLMVRQAHILVSRFAPVHAREQGAQSGRHNVGSVRARVPTADAVSSMAPASNRAANLIFFALSQFHKKTPAYAREGFPLSPKGRPPWAAGVFLFGV